MRNLLLRSMHTALIFRYITMYNMSIQKHTNVQKV